MTTRVIAGIPFDAVSPSLYVCEFGTGTLAIEYQGGPSHLWAARVIRLGAPETCSQYNSLHEIELALSDRRTA